MSMAAAHPARNTGRIRLVLVAVGALALFAVFVLDSPLRRWLFAQSWIRSSAQTSPAEPPSADANAPPSVAANAVVVAFGLVDVEGGEVRLAPQVPGRVAEILVGDGDRVKAGAPLLKLSNALAASRYDQAKEAVGQAALKLQVANRAPKIYLERIQEQMQSVAAHREVVEGLKEGLRDLKQLDDQTLVAGRLRSEERNFNIANAKLEAEKRKLEQVKLHNPAEDIELAERELKKAKAAAAEAKELLDQHTLSAAESGVVLRILVAKGQMLPNLMQPTILFRPDRKTVLRAEVLQEFADRIHKDQKVEAFNDKLDGKKWSGRVTRIADWIAPRRSQIDEPFEKNDVRTMEAIIEFDSNAAELRQGQRLRAVFLRE